MKRTFFKINVLVAFIFVFNTGTKGQINQLGVNYFTAGVPSLEFYPVASIGAQRCPQWCWAASCQMILNYHGLFVTQEQIVDRIFGSQQCLPGTDENILTALTGWAADFRGRFSSIYSMPYISAPADIINNLATKWPLLVCLNNPNGSGHAEVMTAVYYSFNQYNVPVIEKVVLRDPWPGNPSRQEMSWQEFSARVRNIIKVWVIRN